MFFGTNKQRQNQQQEREHRQRESDLVEMEDTFGDILDQFGM